MIRKTQQREVIKGIIFGCNRALSVNEIYDEALKSHPTMGISTVYRTLKSLLESAEIITVDIGGEAPRYEMANLAHHHHFKCRSCDKVFLLNNLDFKFFTILETFKLNFLRKKISCRADNNNNNNKKKRRTLRVVKSGTGPTFLYQMPQIQAIDEGQCKRRRPNRPCYQGPTKGCTHAATFNTIDSRRC